MKTRGVIFDLYNTLIFTRVKKNPYLNLLKSLNLTKEEIVFWRNEIMTKNFNSFEEIKKLINQESTLYTSQFEYDVKQEIENTKVFDDTEFVLNRLSKNYELFLISNLATPYKHCFYNLGLDRWIKDPIFSCDVGHLKPDSEIYQIVIDKSGFQPNQLLMVGDSIRSDFRGAKKMKIQAILKNDSLKHILKDLI
jgi:putative hydrolase of the HAD superfamily